MTRATNAVATRKRRKKILKWNLEGWDTARQKNTC